MQVVTDCISAPRGDMTSNSIMVGMLINFVAYGIRLQAQYFYGRPRHLRVGEARNRLAPVFQNLLLLRAKIISMLSVL
jgi:hypothetical protein